MKKIDSAPKNGTIIQAKIPGHGSDNIIAWSLGFNDGSGSDTGAWVFMADQEPPDCWTDGVCWEANQDNEKSIEPTHWKPI